VIRKHGQLNQTAASEFSSDNISTLQWVLVCDHHVLGLRLWHCWLLPGPVSHPAFRPLLWHIPRESKCDVCSRHGHSTVWLGMLTQLIGTRLSVLHQWQYFWFTAVHSYAQYVLFIWLPSLTRKTDSQMLDTSTDLCCSGSCPDDPGSTGPS